MNNAEDNPIRKSNKSNHYEYDYSYEESNNIDSDSKYNMSSDNFR